MARRKNTKRIDPRYFLNETVDRDRNTGEALDEDIFSSIGDVASRIGAFGKEDKKREFWRRKGEKEANSWYDVVTAGKGGKYIHPTEKDEILRKVEELFATQSHKVDNNTVRQLVSQVVKAEARGGRASEKAASEKRSDQIRKSKEADRRRADAKARKKAAAEREEAESDRARRKADKIADIRGSYIPGAGQSTDYKRREE